MADQHNANIPAMGNTISADIPDIKENLEFHKDCFESITSGWSDSSAASLTLKSDTISEKTSATGVTVDGCLIKDGVAAAATKHGVLNVTVVEIGDWNMDSTATLNVAHGLTLSKIRTVFVMIRNDGDDAYASLEYTAIVSGTTRNAGRWSVNGTNVVLARTDFGDSGVFDSPDYDSTSFNRGWIIIEHID